MRPNLIPEIKDGRISVLMIIGPIHSQRDHLGISSIGEVDTSHSFIMP